MDPRKLLHQHTIKLYIRENNGYGDGYADEPIVIEKVYFEKNTSIDRKQDDQEKANAFCSLFQKIDFKKGDMIEYENDFYVIIEISEFKKPFSNLYEHTELLLKQSIGVQNESN